MALVAVMVIANSLSLPNILVPLFPLLIKQPATVNPAHLGTGDMGKAPHAERVSLVATQHKVKLVMCCASAEYLRSTS